MKKIIPLITILLLSLQTNAQLEPQPKKGTTEKTQVILTSPSTTTQKKSADRKIPGMQLPDLKFAAFTVIANPVNDAGQVKYDLIVSYTIKNEGNVAVLTKDIRLFGYITTEYWIGRGEKNLNLTGVFRYTGYSDVNKTNDPGESLQPGATKQVSISFRNKQLDKAEKPVLLLVIDPLNQMNELDKENNRVYQTILL
ncbi:MAG: hypothetical protein WAU23_14575 [Ferruginibacter sp.]